MAMPEVERETAIIRDWFARNIDGKIVRIAPQARWRPQYEVDVERDGEIVPLWVRGERRDMELIWPLHHEMVFQDEMAKAGMLVPAVYGWIDDLPAFVMDNVAGRPNFAEVPEPIRDQVRATVVDEYLQRIADVHRMDFSGMVERGVDRAARPEDSGIIGIQRFDGVYRRAKVHPDPFLEWAMGWVFRHPPQSKGREGPVVWDSGQLHQRDGHLAAIIDVELGHIGDPMMDLAAWRMRDSIIGFGNFDELYDRYGEITGEPVDLEAIELHHIFFTLTNQLGFSHALRDTPLGSDFATNLQWCNETNIYATEAIAEYLGVELPTVETPTSNPTRVHPATAHLVRALRNMQTDDDYLRHQIRIAFRVARHIDRFDEIGAAVCEADVDDLHQLLGHRPADWFEGERELERFVQADVAEGRHDEALLELFHKRNLRAQMLNGPEGSAMARHIPIQSFRHDAPAGAH